MDNWAFRFSGFRRRVGAVQGNTDEVDDGPPRDKPELLHTNATGFVNWIVIESRSVVVSVPCCINSAFRALPHYVGHCTAIRFQHDFVVQLLSDKQGMRSEAIKLRPSVLGGGAITDFVTRCC